MHKLNEYAITHRDPTSLLLILILCFCYMNMAFTLHDCLPVKSTFLFFNFLLYFINLIFGDC